MHLTVWFSAKAITSQGFCKVTTKNVPQWDYNCFSLVSQDTVKYWVDCSVFFAILLGDMAISKAPSHLLLDLSSLNVLFLIKLCIWHQRFTITFNNFLHYDDFLIDSPFMVSTQERWSLMRERWSRDGRDCVRVSFAGSCRRRKVGTLVEKATDCCNNEGCFYPLYRNGICLNIGDPWLLLMPVIQCFAHYNCKE